MRSISIGGLDLTDPDNGFVVEKTDLWETTERLVVSHDLTQGHGAVDAFDKWQARDAFIRGVVIGADMPDFDRKVARIERLSYSKGLDIVVSNGTLTTTYKGKITRIKPDKDTAPDFGIYTIELWLAQPFSIGETVSVSNRILAAPASAPKYSESVFFNNNFIDTSTHEIAPVIIFTLDRFDQSVAHDSVDTNLSFGNPDTEAYMKLVLNSNDPFYLATTIGDTFRVDCLDGSVTRGGEEVYLEGPFPVWSPASSQAKLAFFSNSEADWQITYGLEFKHRYV